MPAKASLSDMVAAIRDADRPVTASEVAEGAGVTKRTVNNYKEELKSHDEIEAETVGGATAYWHIETGLGVELEDVLLLEGDVTEKVRERANEEGRDEEEVARELLEKGLEEAENEPTEIEEIQNKAASWATLNGNLTVLFAGAHFLSPSSLVNSLMIAAFAFTVGAAFVFGLATLALRQNPSAEPLTALKRRMS